MIFLFFPETLVSGNAGDEKNLRTGGRKLIFLIDFPEIFSFLFLFSFAFFYPCSLFVACFLKLKIYILIHIRLCERVSDKNFFHPADFRTQDYFFWP